MSKGNIADELNFMVPGRAASTATVRPIFETKDGIVLGITALTATASLTALCESHQLKYAPFGIVLCINSGAAISCHVYNASAATTPSFTPLVS